VMPCRPPPPMCSYRHSLQPPFSFSLSLSL
jgi:hypothetical protein